MCESAGRERNIFFFDSSLDDSWNFCAEAASDIELMVTEFNTLLGDMEDALSGGQKQRLLLARALYRKPKILVMDEATSHLEIPNENSQRRD